MDRSLSTEGLPLPLAVTVRPWIDFIETATLGMGAEVRTTTEKACTSLRRRIVMTTPLETALANVRRSAEVLAQKLDRKNGASGRARMEMLLALDALVVGLRNAQPNEHFKRIGLGW